jgi:hypothetical protein
MAQRDRHQDKRRRRQKRLAKRDRSRPALAADADLAPLEQVIRDLKDAAQVPQPASWPGVSDPSLERPDLARWEYAEWATKNEPGRSRSRQLEAGLRQGVYGFLPEIEHWAWEEFFWHGLPGDSWHPLDAYLEHAGPRYPPAAQEQLRRWKAARIGIFQVGDVRDDTVGLQEWEPLTATPVGAPFRAIALNLGGVNIYHDLQGQYNLTYVAPWDPARELFCALGYGTTGSREHLPYFVLYRELRHPERLAWPLPWKADRAAAAQYLREWRAREWHGWFAERITFPFLAVAGYHLGGCPEFAGLRAWSPRRRSRPVGLGSIFRCRRARICWSWAGPRSRPWMPPRRTCWPSPNIRIIASRSGRRRARAANRIFCA